MDNRMLNKKTMNALQRLDEVEKSLTGIVKAVNDLQRLDGVEKSLTGIVKAVNDSFNQVGAQMQGMSEVLDAVVQTLGADVIQKTMAEARVQRAEEQSQKEKAGLEELVAKGAAVASTSIGEKSIVVGREFDKEGVVRTPGRAQVAFGQIAPEMKEAFLNQGPGFTFELPGGGKFEVLEVFDVVEPKPDPVVNEDGVIDVVATKTTEVTQATP